LTNCTSLQAAFACLYGVVCASLQDVFACLYGVNMPA
jgi:hypothetical protein